MKTKTIVGSEESGEPLFAIEVDLENIMGYPITLTPVATSVPLRPREAVMLASALLAVVARLEGEDQWTSEHSKTE